MNEPAMNTSEPASLERGYRRLLTCYPKTFRQEDGRRTGAAEPEPGR